MPDSRQSNIHESIETERRLAEALEEIARLRKALEDANRVYCDEDFA